jgi:hypothetical protein
LLVLVTLAPAVHAESVAALIAAVAGNARFAAPARADVRIERLVDGAPTATAAILLGRGTTVYLEARDGMRALVRPGKAVLSSNTRLVRAAPGQALPGTDLLLEDIAVFTATALKVPQISDDSPAGVVVVGAPGVPSAYVLLAYTIERDPRAVVVRTQYYRDSIGNLVKLRRDGPFVDLGGHSRPGEIAVEDVRQRTSTKLTLTWREVPDASAALFTPAALKQPSGLAWP